MVVTGGVGSSSRHTFLQKPHNVSGKDEDKRIVKARVEERQELLETEKNPSSACPFGHYS